MRRISLVLVLLALLLGLAAPALSASLAEGLAAYEKGDYAEAVAVLAPLAEQGEAEAQLALGRMYENGQGVPHDYDEAARWVRRAAEQGLVPAQNMMAFIYHWGQGVPQSDQQSADWYRRAAEQGDGYAQLQLGFLHVDGIGVRQDDVQAHVWLTLAAENGRDDAVGSRDRIAAGLTPAQLKRSVELLAGLRAAGAAT